VPATPTPSPAALPTTARALPHGALAGILGVCAAVAGAPLVVGSLFGGWSTVLGTLGVLTAAVAVLAWAAIRADVDSVLPVPLRYAAAALPFAAVAGLRWPGAVRVRTALVVAGSVAVVGLPRAHDARQQAQEDAVVTEVGTTARPWVTELDGISGRSPQHTGSTLVWTGYLPADGAPAPELWLFRTGDAASVGVDPCTATATWMPDGDHPVTSCTPVGEGHWLRTTDAWQELLTRRDDAWVGVAARPDVPRPLLEQALAGARPMDDEEYGAWLEDVLPGTP